MIEVDLEIIGWFGTGFIMGFIMSLFVMLYLAMEQRASKSTKALIEKYLEEKE